MRRKLAPTIVLGTTASLIAAVGIPSTPAAAIPAYLNVWQMQYPNSLTDDNLAGQGCQLCHVSTQGQEPWNGYGWEIRNRMDEGFDITESILAAEPLDSDNDPTGATNLEEIMADTQPGWTPGANNTIFFEDGDSQTNQNPPDDVQGDLDPQPASCEGDTNVDGMVDVQDLINVIVAWGTGDADADINDDGVVDVLDLVGVVVAWGDCR